MGVCMSVKHFGVLVFVLETFPFFLSNRERPLLIGKQMIGDYLFIFLVR